MNNFSQNNKNKSDSRIGVLDGVYTCQQERTQELNERIAQRNIPSAHLEPNIDFRPVMTKYSILPVVDQKAPSSVNILRYPTYSPHSVYNVGNNSAPWSGFASSINTESTLRNQFFALQKCDQSAYIPSSDSDLYKIERSSAEANKQTHPLLFKEEEFQSFDPNHVASEHILFNNFTRQQLLNSCGNTNKKVSK